MKKCTPVSVQALTLCLTMMFAAALPAEAHETSDPAGPGEVSSTGPAEAARSARPLTVAVLDFGADDVGAETFGDQISAAVNALLAGEQGIRLVDRADLDRTLEELELNLSGLVDTAQAVRIGHLVGAKIIVTGKAFPLGDKLFVTAKLIGTETSLIDAVLVRGSPGAIDELIVELAMKIADRVRSNGHNLVAQPSDEVDPLPALKERLATRQLPVVAVVIPERHLAGPIAPSAQAPDPAVATEIKKLLIDCGFTVIDTKENDLADWARQIESHDPDAWPRGLANAELVIVGEAFSEYAGRIGNLLSVAARAEMNVIDHETGRIVLADRTTTRGVDLAENIASRNALQDAGRALGVHLLEHLAETLPPREPAPAAPQQGE